MVVKTKFYIPHPPSGTIRRARLLQPLSGHLDRRLLLIVAGPGFGKTTLLAHLLAGLDRPAVYCSLDDGDTERYAMLDCLVTAVEHLGRQAPENDRPPLGETSRQLLSLSPELIDHRQVLGTLINELADRWRREAVIVLDDYHELPAGCPAHQVLDYFIGRLPDNIHLVLSSRTVPPLPSLHKWRARRELFELAQADLRFSRAELTDLAGAIVPRRLADKDIDHLFRRTEGWVTGIILLLQSAPGIHASSRNSGSRQTDQETVFDFFAQEILNRESPAIREFLVNSAVLDPVTSPAARAVTGVSGAAALLEQLARRIQFIQCDDRGCYRYHDLFRQFLLSRCEGREQSRPMFRRAAAYYRDAGDAGRAIECLLQADEPGLAAAAIDDLGFNQLYALPVGRWLSLIPEPLWAAHPLLFRMQSELLANEGKISEHFDCLQRGLDAADRHGTRRDRCAARYDLGLAHIHHGDAGRALRHLRDALGTCPRDQRKLRARILESLGVGMRLRGDVPAARRYLQRSLVLARRIGDASAITNGENSLAILTGQAGDYGAAIRLYQPLLARIGGSYSFEVGAIYSSAAYYAIHAGKIELAQSWLEQGLRTCEPYADNRSRDRLYYALGHLYLHLGRWDLSERYFLMCIEHHTQTGYRVDPRSQYESIDLAYLGYCRGDLAAARARLAGNRFNSVSEGGRLAFQHCLVLAALGRRADAVRLAAALSAASDPLGSFYRTLLAAAIRCAAGDRASVVAHLRRADRLAMRHGYDGILGSVLRSNAALSGIAPRAVSARRLAQLRPRDPSGDADGGADLRINLLGPLEILDPDGAPVPVRWRTRKSLSLLAYLVINRHRCCGSDELMERLWPGTDPKQAGNRLYVTVAQLKGSLADGFKRGYRRTMPVPDLITRSPGGYAINQAVALRTDIELLERQWRDSRAVNAGMTGNLSDLEQCVAMCRGEFAAGLDDAWCLETREHFSRIQRQAFEALADRCAGQRHYDRAIDLYRTALVKDPFAEQLHIKLWRALREANRLTEITADHADLKKALARDLKARISPATEEEYQTLTLAR